VRRHPLSFVFALLARLYRLYFATLRVRILLPDGSVIEPGPYPYRRAIWAVSERDGFALGGANAGRGVTMLVSPGRDGDFAAAAVEALGYVTVRGSSRRGGAAALRSLIGALGSSSDAAIVVDGPLGPVGEAKPGALLVAARTAREIVPVGAAARPAVVIQRAWSGIYIPLPFGRVVIVCGPSLVPPAEVDAEAARLLAIELTARLSDARARALAALSETSLARAEA
jgi:lysophospholipid acyltransferase (LPLAT)-like uncharacterized protein